MYDPERISAFFDEYGEREWERLAPDRPPAERVNFEVHRLLLTETVQAGDRVLEVGAGPGRFTIELAHLDATVSVVDISPRQLELNREKVAEAGFERRVESRNIADVVDLTRFDDDSFDAAVCIGGPLSYVFDRADDALAELLRVTRPGGHVVFSVMSLLGAFHAFFPVIPEFIDDYGIAAARAVFDRGDLPGEQNDGHHLRMYRWRDVQALVDRHPCTLVTASAANFISTVHGDVLAELDEERWRLFLEWELRACREPGALDAGTHIAVVVRK